MEEKILITSKSHKINGYLFVAIITFIWAMKINLNNGEIRNGIDYTILLNYPKEYITTGIALMFVLLYICIATCEIVVTNKRVYGKVGFGRRVDLPLDFISAVSTIRFVGGVEVSTSSGRMKFYQLKDSDEVYKSINRLLLDRQNNKNVNTTGISDADELKKYKELLDEGIISQEEFDTKKKQLLDV